MGEQLILLGSVFIVIGILILFFGLISQIKPGKTKVEGGGIIFIGPFPVGFATNKQIFYVLLAASIFLIVLFILAGRKI